MTCVSKGAVGKKQASYRDVLYVILLCTALYTTSGAGETEVGLRAGPRLCGADARKNIR